MSTGRVSRVLELGLVALPDAGPVGLFSQDMTDVPERLGPDRARVVSPWRPLVEAMEARGCPAGAEDAGPFAAAIVVAGRSRVANEKAVAQAVSACEPGALVLVDGQKTDGIEPLMRAVAARVPVIDSYTKNHGRVFWFAADATCFEAQAPAALQMPAGDRFHTAPGGFSADGPDPASVALADALPARLPPRIADLGAGWGYLSARVLARPEVASVALVEAHHGALAAARANIQDPRAAFFWADVLRWRPDVPVDAVVMNPPFHIGRAADPALGQGFVAAAAEMLTREGALWLVANRQLPYEATAEALFAEVESRPAPPGFKIIVARRPARRRRAGAPRQHREPARDLFR